MNGAKISGVRDGFLDRFDPVFDGGLRYLLLSADGALIEALGYSGTPGIGHVMRPSSEGAHGVDSGNGTPLDSSAAPSGLGRFFMHFLGFCSPLRSTPGYHPGAPSALKSKRFRPRMPSRLCPPPNHPDGTSRPWSCGRVTSRFSRGSGAPSTVRSWICS